jgi:hypothetical protein
MIGDSFEWDMMLADLGVPVSYTALTGGAQLVNGIVDTVAQEIYTEEGLQTVARKTTLRIRDGALTGLLVDRAITVNSLTYHIGDCGEAATDGSRTMRLREG